MAKLADPKTSPIDAKLDRAGSALLTAVLDYKGMTMRQVLGKYKDYELHAFIMSETNNLMNEFAKLAMAKIKEEDAQNIQRPPATKAEELADEQ